MTAFHPLVPSKAIEMIEVAGIQHAQRLVRDHAAAGLLKSYAMLIETTDVGGQPTCVRGGVIPTSLWRRIVREGRDDDVWTGGTVRLAAGDLIGGAPAVEITGIGFNGGDLQRLIQQHCGDLGKPKRPGKVVPPKVAETVDEPAAEAAPTRRRKTPDLSALHSGALLLTVEQVKAALAIGHTKFYALLNAGTLERAPFEGGTRITAASVRKLAGVID